MDFILAIIVALPIFLLCFSLGKAAEIVLPPHNRAT